MNPDTPLTENLEQQRTHIASACIHCGRCARECAFLQRYGDPGQLAESYRCTDDQQDIIPFSCSLCGLCRETCPRDLDMPGLFLEMRRAIVALGRGNYPGHRALLNYERLGTSRLLSTIHIPAGCHTVYFPGCALPGGRPGITRALFEHLQNLVPTLGLVLNCCGKPSHDLGKQAAFEKHFLPLTQRLHDAGVRRVLVNCPNCFGVFRDYAEEIEVVSVYEVLAAHSLPAGAQLSGAVIVHDPCVMRREAGPQQAVRSLLNKLGEWVDPIKHSGRLTRCCGEGGAVHGVNPRLAETWAKRVAKETHGERLVTYCAGCAQFLGRHTTTSHILDLIFEPTRTLGGRLKICRAPFSYLQRWRLKRHLLRR